MRKIPKNRKPSSMLQPEGQQLEISKANVKTLKAQMAKGFNLKSLDTIEDAEFIQRYHEIRQRLAVYTFVNEQCDTFIAAEMGLSPKPTMSIFVNKDDTHSFPNLIGLIEGTKERMTDFTLSFRRCLSNVLVLVLQVKPLQKQNDKKLSALFAEAQNEGKSVITDADVFKRIIKYLGECINNVVLGTVDDKERGDDIDSSPSGSTNP